MTIRHALKELARRDIVVVPEDGQLVAIVNGYVISITPQRERVCFMRVRRSVDKEEPLSDYSPGFLVHSIPELLRAINIDALTPIRENWTV